MKVQCLSLFLCYGVYLYIVLLGIILFFAKKSKKKKYNRTGNIKIYIYIKKKQNIQTNK